ncbi:MAG: glycoside hydrolase family 130 protein [Sedimentisphaerales bacterium]|nr:glycoside hydrolase family 130 protein [Sedimentisphaerales bacterium]
MSVLRYPGNPIIVPQDIKPSRDNFEVVGVFNTGVARLADQVVLLLRVAELPTSSHPDIQATAVYDHKEKNVIKKEFSKKDPNIDFSDPRITATPDGKYLASFSHFRVTTSKDGIKFDVPNTPAMVSENQYETFGLEDPRISRIDKTYYITYVGVSPLGITTLLASTEDFKSFSRHGVIFCPDNKDVMLFPEKINGKYYALHRPVSSLFKKHEIWLAESPDLICWGNHRYLMGTVPHNWDSSRIGGSAVPFRTEQGWLEVYHGVDENNRYCLGAVLLDAEKPWKVIARTQKPILEPQADYEIEGFFGNVVFTCGLLYEQQILKIYYGVADTSIAYAEIPLQDVLENLNL